ncbi:MAG: cytochrome c-type biogenesis protein [Actinomycetota bacterium]
MKRTWPLIAAAAGVVAVAALLAAGRDDRPATIVDRTQTVAASLRCPVCQNLSVADSPSRLAGEMRAEIEERLRAGASDDEVRAFFVARYGEWVLLEPSRRGLNLVPVIFPLAAVLVGVGIWAFAVGRRRRAEDAPVSAAERRRIDDALGRLEDTP